MSEKPTENPEPPAQCPFGSRRSFLTTAAGTLIAAAASSGLCPSSARAAITGPEPKYEPKYEIEPFWGAHQSGIVTTQPKHTYFAAFDLQTEKREEVISLLKSWTDASARMSIGQPAHPLEQDLSVVGKDTGEALELSPSKLTLTFGFGASLFKKDGKDRYGLASRRPEALVDMPKFNGDQLVEGHTGGDLSVQACADDPQVAFHAVRQLALLAGHLAKIRWAQIGFLPNTPPQLTPRNLMGFKDGTQTQQIWTNSFG